jgi:CheY-like chemotaxis protein
LLFRTILENNNAKVITTDRPHDVQQILKEKPVDLILMDIQMPGLDGITLTKKIRAESKSTIPILALTATTNNTERAKCVEAGFDGFLVKPIEESILINSIANFIGWDQLEIQTKGVADTNELDLNNLFEIGNNDLDFVYNMLVLFINNFSNGMKELKEKLNEGNKQDLASVAHKMVPPCRHLGLNDIVKILKSIEGAGRNEMEITELNLHIKNLEKDGKKIIQQLESEVERIKPHKIKS